MVSIFKGSQAVPKYATRVTDRDLVLQAFALYWEMLPFCLFIGLPLLVLSHFTTFSTLSINRNSLDVLFSWLLVAFLIFMLPEVSMKNTSLLSTQL